jgi:transposase
VRFPRATYFPLYRQSAILQRDTGVSITRATMDGWIVRVGVLIPIVGAMRRELLAGSYIQADETPLPVQMPDGSGKNHQAFLWQYSKPGGNVVFEFRMGRGRGGPVQFLGRYEGILQTGGYAAYVRVGGSRMVHAACWSHARRKIFDAVRLNPEDRLAGQLVAWTDELFAVDAEARDAGMDYEARHVLRQERSRPLLETMKKEMEGARSAVLPASALGKGVSYTLGLWDRLTRFLEYAELELSNNWTENSMRPVALGRKNWIHVGSEQAGPKVAAILSVVETCRRLKAPVREYLEWVLPGLGNVSVQKVNRYTPAVWAASRS